jgi:hypothetical protein
MDEQREAVDAHPVVGSRERRTRAKRPAPTARAFSCGADAHREHLASAAGPDGPAGSACAEGPFQCWRTKKPLAAGQCRTGAAFGLRRGLEEPGKDGSAFLLNRLQGRGVASERL